MSIIVLLISVFFCSFHPANPSTAPASSSGPPSLRKDSTPVIANVVSLASTPAAQPTVNSNNVLQGRGLLKMISLFLNLYSWTFVFVPESFPLKSTVSSLCFTSLLRVAVLSFLYLSINNDVYLFSCNGE